MIELSPEILTFLMFASLLVFLLLGHPVAFVLGGLSIIFGIIGWGPEIFSIFMSRIVGITDNYVLVAVPLFILMGNILGNSGVAEGLFDSVRHLFGPVRGGLAVGVIVVSTLLAACTGIIGASVVTMGLMALPVMLKYKYDKKLSCGCIAAGGSLGILIPPSIMLVVMGAQTGMSVGKLYAGAILPGLTLSALYIIWILVICYLHPQDGPSVTAEERAAISSKQLTIMLLKSLVPPMILILGVLGSMFAGIATPTEAAGVGSLLAFLMSVIYGKFTWRNLYQAVISTAKATSMVIIILIGATCFTGVFLGLGGGEVTTKFILGLGLGKWGVFFIMMLISFIVGCFIDWIGIVMLTFPIFIPIATKIGFDPFWFVVATAVLLQSSFLTPPFGNALFYLKAIAPEEVKTSDIWWGAIPYIGLQAFGLIIVLLFPEFITWLPTVLVK